MSERIGEYEVVRELGRGGFGRVVLAQHVHLGTRAAVKVLHAAGNESARSRFKKEAQVATALEHPNLLRVTQFGLTDAGEPYLVMPYVGDDDGPMDLVRFVASRGGALDEATARALTRQILEGLAHAHAQGVIHRDLKPRNVLVDVKDGEPRALIADFGLVRVVGEAAVRDRVNASISQSQHAAPLVIPDEIEQTLADGASGTGSETAAMVGTWEYMSPELKQGAEASVQSDLYAVGLLTHWMVTGTMPGAYAAPDARKAAFEPWFARMLSQTADARYETVREAAAELPGVRGETHSGRRRAVAVLAGATSLILLVGFIALLIGVSVSPNRMKDQVVPELNSVIPNTETAAPKGSPRTDDVGWDDRVDSTAEVSGDRQTPAPDRPSHLDRRTIEFAPGVTANFVYVDAPGVASDGFMMGSPASEEGFRSDETQRQVVLTSGFWMQTTEVTQRQWQSVMGESQHDQQRRGMANHQTSVATGPDLPMCYINWVECQEFVVQLRVRGILARLPTEAEWEFACRAGTQTPFSFGHTINSDDANYDSRETYGNGPRGRYRAQAIEVASLRANAWGLYDMHGNVYEWCADWYSESPRGLIDPVGPSLGMKRVRRGGAWGFGPDSSRSASRGAGSPGNRNPFIGLRLVIDSE